MKIVYVSSPYSEGRRKENIKYAKDACRYVAESGHAFFASHLLYPQIMDDKQPGERKHGMDMGLAVKPYLEHIGRKPESDQVILFGYSQGGSTTLGVMKMIQKECWNKLPLKQVYAGAGPYDLALTYDVSVEEDLTGIPCAIAMIVQGVNIGNNLGLEMKDFFKQHLLDNYDEWINSKAYTVKQINTFIGAKSLRDIMTDEGRDKSNPKTAKLYKSLMINSVLDFTPKCPLHMCHSMDDQTVPYQNSQKAEQYFKGQNVTYDFGHYGAHGTCFLHFLFYVNKQL